MKQVTPTRPILRYHGGKWLLAPWIISTFPKHRIYVEPFAGAGSVLFRKPKSYAEVVNDLDGEIVNVYRVLRCKQDAEELERLLRLTPFARDEFNAAYENSDNLIEQARKTIVKAFMGFGSDGITAKHRTGFRSNSNRSNTTPAHDWTNYPNQIAAFSARLSGVVIENKTALDVIKQHDGAETLFYVDPPYVHSTRSRKKESCSYRHEMSEEDHQKLLTTLKDVAGKVVLSGYSSELYDTHLADWRTEQKLTFADGRSPRTEKLWLSPNCETCGTINMFDEVFK